MEDLGPMPIIFRSTVHPRSFITWSLRIPGANVNADLGKQTPFVRFQRKCYCIIPFYEGTKLFQFSISHFNKLILSVKVYKNALTLLLMGFFYPYLRGGGVFMFPPFLRIKKTIEQVNFGIFFAW